MATAKDAWDEAKKAHEKLDAEKAAPAKPAMDPVEIYRRNVHMMPDRVLASHLRRKARKKSSMIDSAWATILSAVFENTKPYGKVDPYIK